MSAFIVRQRVDKGGPDVDVDGPVGRLGAKNYLDRFINPPEYLEAQRKKKEDEKKKQKRRFPEHPQRDVLLFLIQHAPLDWQREGGVRPPRRPAPPAGRYRSGARQAAR